MFDLPITNYRCRACLRFHVYKTFHVRANEILVMSKVKGWKASYYHDSQRKWLYGELLLYPRCIRFVEDGEHERTDFRLFYDEFVELRKDTTNVFYAAITIRIKDEKYWFSSVTDRGSVFNNIEHFWKERLFASG